MNPIRFDLMVNIPPGADTHGDLSQEIYKQFQKGNTLIPLGVDKTMKTLVGIGLELIKRNNEETLIKFIPRIWETITRIEVIDPDGWNRKNFQIDWNIPLTLTEFLDKCDVSTCSIYRREIAIANAKDWFCNMLDS